MPAFEVILRQPNAPDRIRYRYRNRAEAEIGDVMEIDGRPWMIVERQPPFELRRIERIIDTVAISDATGAAIADYVNANSMRLLRGRN